jgi:hypothetical protein
MWNVLDKTLRLMYIADVFDEKATSRTNNLS